jgi:hypothetical protein
MDGKFSHRSTNLDQANQALSLLHTGLLLDLPPKVLCGVHCLLTFLTFLMSLMSLIVLCTEPRGNGSRQFRPAQHRPKAVARGSPRFLDPLVFLASFYRCLSLRRGP